MKNELTTEQMKLNALKNIKVAKEVKAARELAEREELASLISDTSKDARGFRHRDFDWRNDSLESLRELYQYFADMVAYEFEREEREEQERKAQEQERKARVSKEKREFHKGFNSLAGALEKIGA